MLGSDPLVIKTAFSIPKYSISVVWDISWTTTHSSRAGTWRIFGSVMLSSRPEHLLKDRYMVLICVHYWFLVCGWEYFGRSCA